MKGASSSRCKDDMDGRIRWVLSVALAVMLVSAAPASAHADGIFTPFIGTSFGSDRSDNVASWGLSVAAMAGGAFGLELDFFRTDNGSQESTFLTDSRMTTVTGNLIIGIPNRWVRPYGTAGLGWMRTETGLKEIEVGEKIDGLAVAVGGGLIGFVGEHIGARVDLRYVRTVTVSDTLFKFNFAQLNFWRASAGVALKF